MDSSDSEGDGRQNGYQPVLAEKLSSRVNSPAFARNPSANTSWPKDGVSVYTNELFTDGGHDVLGNEQPTHEQSHTMSPAQRPGSTQRMAAQKSSLAARRQERMQANVYERNESLANRNMNSPSALRHTSMPEPSNSNLAPRPAQRAMGGDGMLANGLRSSYDPHEEELARQVQTHAQAMVPKPAPPPRIDTSDIRAFLQQPGPKNGPVLCYIVRDKGSAKMYPRYNLFLEEGKKFLLAARKRKKTASSNYVISLDFDDLNRDSDKFFGKLRSNFVGTEFTVFDAGDKAAKKKREKSHRSDRSKDGDDDEDEDDSSREELASVLYQYNVLGTRGPRKMTATIPTVDHGGRRLYKPINEEDSLLNRTKENRNLDELVIMRNKPPRWNEELNAYCLNFNGRVTEASVKNFQLVSDDNQNHVILQFGKIGKNTFTMDYQWPMNALQAFGVCLSSFDNKLACE